MNTHFHLLFDPLLPLWALTVLGIAALAAIAYALVLRSAGALFRATLLALLLFTIANPILLAEQREPLKDTALIVIDDTPSMKLADRKTIAQRTADAIAAQAAKFPGLDLATIHVTTRDETDLFDAIAKKRAELPQSRLAGIILITDGQVHDAPATIDKTIPLHALITGKPDEIDRRLTIAAAPAYGIVGKTVTITLRVDDEPQAQGDTAAVTLNRDDGTTTALTLPVGKDVKFDLPVTHAGHNLFAFTTPEVPKEITTLNNAAAVTVNGIRDRLRVLLVSGAPHTGERVWRNFLKADPDVDLVHFTILRSPDKLDAIPPNQMALIAFPVRELFDTKLKTFDLIIFDRLTRAGLIPPAYLQNVADYVENGGALLISNSTADDTLDTIATSPLGRLLAAQPAGGILTGAFRPKLTDTGLRHPVTAPLKDAIASSGHWYRQIANSASDHAAILLSGLQDQPLLALDHVGEGRVAQFTSDQFWLWARHHDGGGPQAELLRRTAHWLMKEPELDENALTARSETADPATGATNDSAADWQIIATERNLTDAPRTLTVIDPGGKQTETQLTASAEPGQLTATIPAPVLGLYHLKDGDRQTMVMAGPSGTPEFTAMRATADKLAPLAKSTGSNIFWLDKPIPELRRTVKAAAQSGPAWLGLQRNAQFRITGSHEIPLYPAWVMLALLLAAAMGAWWREGRESTKK